MILSSKVDPPDHHQVEDGAPTCSLPSPGTRLPHSYSWYREGHCNRGNSSAFSMTICYLMLSSSQTRYFGISLHLCVYQVARRGVRVSDQLVAALLKSVFQVNQSKAKGFKGSFSSYRTLIMGSGVRDPWTGTM